MFRVVYSSGIRGIADEGRSQNLVAIAMAAHTLSSFAFGFQVFVATHTESAFSLTLRQSPLLRCRQRLPIDAGPTDSIGAPAWLLQWLLTPRRVGRHTARRWAHLFARALSAPWAATRLRRTAVLALQLQNHKGECLSGHSTLLCLSAAGDAVILILLQAGWTPRGRQAVR